MSPELPPIVTLPEPSSDNEHDDTSRNPMNQSPSTASQVVATQLGGYSFVIPSRLSPVPSNSRLAQKRRILTVPSYRAAKARRTSSSSSAVAPQSSSPQSPAIEFEDPDEVVKPPQVSQSPLKRKILSKGKHSVRAPQMSGLGSLSNFFNRPSVQKPPTSAPAKLQPDHTETIVIDSSDDESDNVPAQAAASQPPPAARAPEVINISDSDSDDALETFRPKTRSPPNQITSKSDSPKGSRKMAARNQPNPDSSSSLPVQSLPALPPSSDNEQSPVEHHGFPTIPSSPIDKTAHRMPQETQEGSSSDSGSSGRVVETAVTLAESDEPSFVLNSEGSSSSRNASPRPTEHAGQDFQRGRERSMTLASLRDRAPTRSSPSPGSISRSGAATEPELEDIVASVSLHDTQPQTDKSIAQTTAAVGNIALDDQSEHDQSSANDAHSERSALASSSVSSDRTTWYKCSIQDCAYKFTTTSQLHTHMSRDHGVRLSRRSEKVRGKRKAIEVPKTPTKRKLYGSRLAQPPPPPLVASASGSSSGSSPNADVYVEKKNTIGFDPFVRSLPQPLLPRPAIDDEDDEEEEEEELDHATISDGVSLSPPRTPAPHAPKLRRPHPKDRPVIPDTPSENLSPSKQLAIKKDEVIIPGEELVTWRVDIVNSMPESYRNGPGVRLVFEAFMDEAMRENEPCAPAIPVENLVDDQPCPPWEFVYCNRVLYGENVPRPDLDALEGCDCLGPCDPNNRNCACVKKQEAVWEKSEGLEDFTGFAFNADGTIRFHHGEIYACNSKCTCDAECQNKVWQQGRKYLVSIRKTEAKGWGVFAKEYIPPGSYIGVYTGELLTEGMTDKRTRVYDEFGRTYVLGLDFHHIPQTVGLPNYSVDAFHAGNFTRFLNHSCNPNLVLSALYVDDPDIRKPWLALFSDREIAPGEELTFSYSGLDVNDPADRVKAAENRAKAARGKGKRGKVFEKCLCGVEGCFGILFK